MDVNIIIFSYIKYACIYSSIYPCMNTYTYMVLAQIDLWIYRDSNQFISKLFAK